MVDLRAELRPLVDQPARAPLPLAEVAGRARRRRQRKRAGAALGVAAGCGLVLLLAVPGPRGEVTTADEPDRAPNPTAPATSPPRPPSTAGPTPTTAAPPPVTEPASPSGELVPSVGVTATATTTSSWDRGSCVEVRLTNASTAAVDWEVLVAPAGRITTVWNATTADTGDGRVAFHGEDWNAALPPHLDTTFGYCIEI